MPQGSKDKYTDKQKRQAEHIEEGYEKHGVSEKESEARAWATVNKISGGGKKPGGSGRGKAENHEPERKGGVIGSSHRSAESRSAAAKKGWETRRQKGKS